MEAILEKKLEFDKSEWKPVKFGDVVREPKESIKDPEKSGVEYVVGLEHIETEDIHLRSFNTLEESTTFTKSFKKGDVLFGRRRAYLKKAALAEFDGICSGDITVFRAKENLLPELLPFIVNNEKFFDWAVKHSAGGLSPRVKFKDLAKYEFLLPPKDQQAQIAELLWAMDYIIENEKETFKQLDYLFKSKSKYISDNHIHKGQYEKIKDICYIKDNQRRPLNSRQRGKMDGDIPYYGANGRVDYLNDYIFDEDLVLIAEDGGNFKEFFQKELAYRISGKSWVNNHAHVLAVKENRLTIDWLFYSLAHKNILKYIIGTTRLKLNKAELENIPIWIPKPEVMKKLSQEMRMIDDSRRNLSKKISKSLELQKAIINQIF